MRDTIYTIPISEVFEPKEGCPFCRMRDRVEEHGLEYIMGAAMMEPDVRQDTNRVGFCAEHFRMMLTRKNRLSLGLMLQSHLDWLRQEAVNGKSPLLGKDNRAKVAREAADGCFVCGRIRAGMDRMTATLLDLWQKDASFRELFAQQEFICFAHFTEVLSAAEQKMPKKRYPEFAKALAELTGKRLDAMKRDIDTFCNLFDYRTKPSGPIPEEIRLSPERAAEFLTARGMIPPEKS